MASSPTEAIEREIIWIEDRVHGKRGLYVDLERVPPEEIDGDIEEGYRLVYIPSHWTGHALTMPFKMILSYLPWFSGGKTVTDTVYPGSAIDGPMTVKTQGKSVPEKVIVLHEDQYGRSPYADMIGETREKSLAETQSKAESAESDKVVEKLRNIGGEQAEVVPDRENRGEHR